MIDISENSIEIRSKPTSSALRRIKKAKNVEDVWIFDSAILGPMWANHAEVFKDIGIRMLNAHRFGRKKDSFEWLSEFSFITELCLLSDQIPDTSVFASLPHLKGLAVGLERRGVVKDAAVIAPITDQLEWLTLIGRWKNCESLSNLGELTELALSYFVGDSLEFLSDLAVKKITLQDTHGIDLSFLRSLSNLTALDLLPLPKGEPLPDLKGLTALRDVDVMKSERQHFDPSAHFGKDVTVEVY